MYICTQIITTDMKKNLLNFASAICFWVAAYYKRGEPFNESVFSLDWLAIFAIITLGIIIKEYNESNKC